MNEIKICPTCKKEITGRQKRNKLYCSRKCRVFEHRRWIKNVGQERPKCTTLHCLNLAHKTYSYYKGKRRNSYYGLFCDSCLRRKYGVPSGGQARRAMRALTPIHKCSLCGWDGPCDIHRIIFGKDGGEYTKGNVLEVCPNCHRLIHLGKLQIK